MHFCVDIFIKLNEKEWHIILAELNTSMELISNEGILVLINRTLQFVVIVSVIAAVIAYFMKEYTVVKVIKNIFAVLFILASAGNAIYFIASIFLGQFRLYNLTQGIVLFVIGSALKRWKLPANPQT